ncbi:MAG: hypothetical protein Q7K25_04390 [Actinomycetota bacterium]|nr:hypothetical protein [Actinomycetota bacterium]
MHETSQVRIETVLDAHTLSANAGDGDPDSPVVDAILAGAKA